MTEKFIEVQNETVKDTLNKLKEHHKCLIVRPTGFGKTRTAVDDIMTKFKHVVFLYPFDSVLDSVNRYNTNNLNIQSYSYMKLLMLYKKNSYDKFKKIFSKFNFKNTIFIMDEAHRIGAENTSVVIEKLMTEICPKANFLGMTATPNRTDKLEIKWHFFDGITPFEYTIVDAIRDGIFPKPYYVYTPLNGTQLESKLVSEIDAMDVSLAKKNQLKSNIKTKINPQKLNIENLDEIIQNNLHNFKDDMDYYKFILFFSTYKDIHRKREEIVNAFSKVFPHCEINVYIVTSESKQTRENLNVIQKLNKKENTIDLIFTINILSLGYHCSDITGIMMFRQTISQIIYIQQLGRCLSVVEKNRAIIFDFVDNLNIDVLGSVFNAKNKKPNTKINSAEIALPEDCIILDDLYKELLDIKRLINNAITEGFEKEVVNAYRKGWIPIDYALTKLHLHCKEDFMKILERYE